MRYEEAWSVIKQLKLNAIGLADAKEIMDGGGRLEEVLTAYLTAEMRAVGYTEAALEHPKDGLGLIMMAAWCNVRPDQLPFGARFDPSGSSEKAWARVGASALAYLREHDGKEP